METPIAISTLNDFVFCPLSIYFHSIYGGQDSILTQCDNQINGTAVHKAVDNGLYSTKKDVLQGLDVYCEKYNLIGKIDCFDVMQGKLIERKRKVNNVYDGYVFQVYAQCFALREMGYDVKKIVIHSYIDNKNFPIKLPEEDEIMFQKFEKMLRDYEQFDLVHFVPTNQSKCSNCIYSDLCDRTLA